MAVTEGRSAGEGSEEEWSEEDALEDTIAGRIENLEIVTDSFADGEDEEDDESNDAVWSGGGLRGFVQKPEEPWKILRQYFPSKVGGVPAWLDPLNLPQGEQILCGICDKPLQFVLQVYAPVEDDDGAFHRTLFVFICTSLACLQQDELQQRRTEKRLRSVKVFRSQLPRDSPFYSSSPPNPNGSEPLLKVGTPLCCWCGTWKGTKLCGGCKQSRYCSPLHQMDHWRGDHAPYCRRVQERLKSSSPDTVDGTAATTETPSVAYPSNLWPEFELIVDETGGEEDAGDSDDNRDLRTGTGRLLADYESRRRQGMDFSAKDVQGVEESSAEEQQWALFQAEMSESPEQVLWYLRSADAKPLWPRLEGQPKDSDIPVCSLCGSDRTFEFQIFPQLLYFFGVQDKPDSLDWGTIAFYSCSHSCKIQGYCEEFAWVQPGFA